MNRTRRHVFAVLAVGLLLASVFGAGCISNLSPLPNEVMVRENVISVDPEYVPSSLIISLLTNPNGYEASLFDALDAALPRDKPVIEIGAGIGVVSAYVNDKIYIKSEHIALEPNPYLTPLLKETKEKNGLGTRFVQAAIDYESSFVPYTIARNVVVKEAARTYDEELVKVQSLTLSEIVRDSSFVDKRNISLIIDADDVANTILDNEPSLSDSVALIITTIQTEEESDILQRKAANAGYRLAEITTDESGLTTLVFVRN